MVLSHNAKTRNTKFKGGSGKAKISYNSVKGYKPEQVVKVKEETVVVPTARKKVVKKAAKRGTYMKDTGFLSPDSVLSK